MSKRKSKEQLAHEHCEYSIAIWSIRPPPVTPEGRAWAAGCRKGFQWGLRYAKGLINKRRKSK